MDETDADNYYVEAMLDYIDVSRAPRPPPRPVNNEIKGAIPWVHLDYDRERPDIDRV